MQNIEKFIHYFQCVDCGGQLSFDSKLICKSCQREYEVVEGVPVFLPSDVKDDQKSQLDAQSKYFDKEYTELPEYKLENWRKSMIKRLDLASENQIEKENKVFCDFGVGGTAYTVIEQAKKYGHCLGTDISLQGMIKASKYAEQQGVGDKCFFFVATVEKLPLKSKAIDFTASISVLEHLFDDQKAISELCRVSNDVIYIVVPNTYKRVWLFLWPMYYYNDKKVGHLRHYAEEDLEKKFKSHDFDKKQVIYNGHLVKISQILLNKYLSNEKWWKMEEKDFVNKSKIAAQLNLIF